MEVFYVYADNVFVGAFRNRRQAESVIAALNGFFIQKGLSYNAVIESEVI